MWSIDIGGHVEMVAGDELSGHFEAALGTLADELRGRFHADVMSADVEP